VEHTTALGFEEERAAAPVGVKERVALGFEVERAAALVADLPSTAAAMFLLSWSGGTELLEAE
jgi:hypothetical protein